jgi:lysophospholipase L1-like esterase
MKTALRSMPGILVTSLLLFVLVAFLDVSSNAQTALSGKTSATILHGALLAQANVQAQEQLPDLQGILSTQDVVKIMPLGDSITAGVHSSSMGGYRVWLWQDCVESGWNVEFVGSQRGGPASLPDKAHEGHSGWRIDQISAHVVGWLTSYQPQVVLLHIGTNDILQGYSVATALARLSYLVDQITTMLPMAIVIVAQITPLGRPLLDAKVREYNQGLVALMRRKEEEGQRIVTVDMYEGVPLADIADGIHPDDAGYALMAGVWYSALAPLFADKHAQPVAKHLFA